MPGSPICRSVADVGRLSLFGGLAATAGISRTGEMIKPTATVIRERLVNEWPPAVRESAGSWGDFPALEEIRGEAHTDIERENL
jgi:hypothetical protein